MPFAPVIPYACILPGVLCTQQWLQSHLLRVATFGCCHWSWVVGVALLLFWSLQYCVVWSVNFLVCRLCNLMGCMCLLSVVAIWWSPGMCRCLHCNLFVCCWCVTSRHVLCLWDTLRIVIIWCEFTVMWCYCSCWFCDGCHLLFSRHPGTPATNHTCSIKWMHIRK